MRMTERDAATAEIESYGEMSFLQLLVRFMWPFWLFRDASRGDRCARAAAYRHNRSMRIHLPGYLMKWMFGSALAFALTAAFDSAAAASHTHAIPAHVFSIAAAGGGILFAGSLCVLFVTGYVYLYLGKHDA
jgi:hypothetical protein